MTAALSALGALMPGLSLPAASSPVASTSRYYGLDTAQMTLPDGRVVAYFRRRFVPQPDQYTTLVTHTVVEGDRLDNVTARYLGHPEQFWRLCDSNGVLRPQDLTDEVGGNIAITLPLGIQGAQVA